MMLFSCPNCGPRNETEFHYGGQAHVSYPEHPEELTDREWGEYLFYRQNTRGLFAERWVHSAGCRKWFNMLRDTVSYDITAVYQIGERPPVPRTPHATAGSTMSNSHVATLEGTQP